MRSWAEIRDWRRTQRHALLHARLAIPDDRRASWNTAITERVMALLPALDERLVGIYWPAKGEYDLSPLARALEARDTPLALPAVVQKAAPLVFRAWRSSDRMALGVWNIPQPAEGAPVFPDALLVPLLGFDRQAFRLGYGGGYYDRTVAAMPERPLLIGLGYEQALLPTIHPMPHDVPMDLIVTEERTRCVSARGTEAWAASVENPHRHEAWRCLWSRA